MEQKKREEGLMRLSGWVFLVFSNGFIATLTIFCFYKIFTKKKVE